MQVYDLAAIGALAVDDLLYVDEFPKPDTKVRVLRRLRQAGGLAGNALIAAARLGASVAYAGRLGDDELSRLAAEELRREGVDLCFAERHAGAQPAHSTIIVERRHGTRTVLSSSNGLLGPGDETEWLRLLSNVRVLLIDHHNTAGTLRAVRAAKATGTLVAADVERRADGPFDELLDEIEHLVVSLRFARQLSGCRDPADACRSLFAAARRAVVVTCGAEGCWWWDGRTAAPTHQPAYSVPVVDTTGCGDVFHGAYCAGLARGWTIAQCVRLAAAAAALKATREGGGGSPTAAEVEAFWQSRGETGL